MTAEVQDFRSAANPEPSRPASCLISFSTEGARNRSAGAAPSRLTTWPPMPPMPPISMSKRGRRRASERTPLNRNEAGILGRDRLLSAARRRWGGSLARLATRRASAVDLSNLPSQQSPRVRFRKRNNRIVVLNAEMRKFIRDDVFHAAGEKELAAKRC